MSIFEKYADQSTYSIVSRYIEPLTDARELGLVTSCVEVVQLILDNDSDRMAFVICKNGKFGRLPIVLMMDDALEQIRQMTLMEEMIVNRNVRNVK